MCHRLVRAKSLLTMGTCSEQCPLLLFCCKAADNLINRTTKRAMRVIYDSDNAKVLDALSQRDGNLTIYKKKYAKPNAGNI